MPGKGQRVASRQAQLGRRRRRQNRGPTGAPVAEPQEDGTHSGASESVAATVPVADGVSQNTAPPAPAAPRTVSAAAQPRSARTRTERPTAYNYMAPELRRIGIMGGILTVVLLIVAFLV